MATPLRPDNRSGPFGAAPMAPRSRRKPGVPDRPGRRTPGAPPPAADPYASILAGYPQPQTDAQLGATAQGMIDPLVQALTDSINRRATSGAGAIRGYTTQIANDLGQYAGSAKGIFQQAEGDTAAANNALANRLSGGGTDLAAQLGDRLKGIGNGADPAIAGITQGVAQTGAGSGNASYATGNAALENLIGHGAAAQEYAAKLPEFARLEGIQRTGQLEQQAQNDIATGAEQIRGRLPELVQSLRSANDQKAANLAGEREHLLEYQQGRQDSQAGRAEARREFDVVNREKMLLAKMASETDAAKAAQDWQEFLLTQKNENARLTYSQGQQNQRSDASIADQDRRARIAAAAKIKAARARSGAKGLTAGEVASISSKAANDADLFYYGQNPKQHAVQSRDPQTGKVTVRWIDTPGTGTPGLDYGDAVKRLMAKYPSLGREGAMQLLNNYYAPGERGRPAPASQSKDPAVNPNAAGPPAP